MRSLLFHQGRYHQLLMISRSQVVGGALNRKRMFSNENTSDTLHEIGEKARSTAEEFTRKAKEGKESMKETAQEVMETAKDATIGETQADKEKFKEKVEEGNYDKIGRD
ncbi:uncharacterized protein A4U43_C08F15550 [Asparagus officinalis]|uniref:uncharacterized protein LOC109820698 n=1 Tax=Asparagus officinalis TaxID=4686 RepID=UPI00098E2276|nr:uncharacterized protein LOC109820698 [Asparagus officinalis]ONK60210.1 uncharacterized protein A4U43_C08F15550 [Asparagus officinalis]